MSGKIIVFAPCAVGFAGCGPFRPFYWCYFPFAYWGIADGILLGGQGCCNPRRVEPSRLNRLEGRMNPSHLKAQLTAAVEARRQKAPQQTQRESTLPSLREAIPLLIKYLTQPKTWVSNATKARRRALLATLKKIRARDQSSSNETATVSRSHYSWCVKSRGREDLLLVGLTAPTGGQRPQRLGVLQPRSAVGWRGQGSR